MGFLDKLFGRGEDIDASDASGIHADVPIEREECPHTNLVPKWDKPEDIGHEDKASHFDCGTCGGTFNPAEAQELRETEAERIGAIPS